MEWKVSEGTNRAGGLTGVVGGGGRDKWIKRGRVMEETRVAREVDEGSEGRGQEDKEVSRLI